MRKHYFFSFCFLLFLSCASSEKKEEYKNGLGGDSIMNYKDNSHAIPDSADTVPNYSMPDTTGR